MSRRAGEMPERSRNVVMGVIESEIYQKLLGFAFVQMYFSIIIFIIILLSTNAFNSLAHAHASPRSKGLPYTNVN